MAEACGLPPMMTYSLAETARYTGVRYRSLLDEVNAGHLRSLRPNGAKRGWRVRPEWVDEWMGGDEQK